jgi:hypothetical protein
MDNNWSYERKENHRKWIVDTVFKNQRSILKDDVLKKGLCFASLAGTDLEEFQWYRDNKPFFTANQYIAIDRKPINPNKIAEYSIPSENIYCGEEMEHVLRRIRNERKIAIINADYLCTMNTCINSIQPMLRTVECCADKIGECFLLVNAVTEIINSKEITKINDEVTSYICGDFIYDYFPDLDYVPITRNMLKYKGKSASTVMFSFCIHIIKK